MKGNAISILRAEMEAGQNVLLVGPPGIGKTSMIIQVAKECGYSMEVETEEGIQSTLLRASLMERVDLTGCMVPDHDLGITRQLPFSLIKGLQKTNRKIILFPDDLGQAPLEAQASFMRFFDNNFFPPNVCVWAATNRPGDKAGVNSLCEPLRSRFHSAYIVPTPETKDKADGGVLLCEWKELVEQWVNWAFDHEAPPEIIAWHRSTNGKSLYNWSPNSDPSVRLADFRSWGAMIKRWNSGLRGFNQISAVLGKAVAVEFTVFAKLSEKLPSAEEVWTSPMKASVPTDSSAQYLIASVLAQQVTIGCAEAFVNYVGRLPRVMTAYAVQDAYRRLGSRLAASKAWTKWYKENASLFGLEY